VGVGDALGRGRADLAAWVVALPVCITFGWLINHVPAPF
jgi:hypothetical protein